MKQNAKAKKLADLTDKALDKLGDVMKMSPEVTEIDHEGNAHETVSPAIVSAQVKAASTIISTQMRADENELRQVEQGQLEDLLKALRGEGPVPVLAEARPLSGES